MITRNGGEKVDPDSETAIRKLASNHEIGEIATEMLPKVSERRAGHAVKFRDYFVIAAVIGVSLLAILRFLLPLDLLANLVVGWAFYCYQVVPQLLQINIS